MAKRRRRCCNDNVSIDNVEFFKVFIPHLCSRQLLIPPDFVKDFKKTIEEQVTLKVQSGLQWYVDVKQTDNGVFFTNGWQSFVHDHNLNAGEFLVFTYEKSYTFKVKIFGTNGYKKEPLAARSIVPYIKIEKVEEEEEDDGEEIEEKPRCNGARTK